jgi:lipoprotein NlpD
MLAGGAFVRGATLIVALAWSFLVACGSTPTQAPTTYTVKRGDTLYSIAWRHRLNYQDIARWNGIRRDYVIHPGQKLKLYPSSGARQASASGSESKSRAAPRTANTPARVATPPRIAGPPVKWLWPVTGGKATLTTRPNGGYGLTIAGKRGDDVRAAGAGRVVYTGSGLLGYGQLIIVKHNETYLSAYGHTDAVAVREGQTVTAGQRIASMGAGPQGDPLLYFEIRVNGSPSNPLPLLPIR